MSAHAHDRRHSASSMASSRSAAIRLEPAGRAGRHDAVLRLRPAAARRPRRAAAHDAAGRDRPELRGQGEPDAGRRPAPCRASSTRFDVASALEMRTGARHADAARSRISFAGPGKTAAELSQAVAAGVTIEMESRTEAERVDRDRRATSASGRGWPCASTRTSSVKGSGMRMGGGPQQFGVDAEQVPALLGRPAAADVEFLGFHVFAGSQNLDAEIICEAQRKTVELVLALAETAPAPIRVRQSRRRLRDPVLRQGPAARPRPRRREPRRGDRRAHPPSLPEAGWSSNSGATSSASAGCTSRASSTGRCPAGRRILVVDGGMHHQLAASGNFGQVIRRNYPVAVGNRLERADAETVSVVGCLCTPLDLLGDDVALAATPRSGTWSCVPGRRLRSDREPDRVPRPPAARRGARVA